MYCYTVLQPPIGVHVAVHAGAPVEAVRETALEIARRRKRYEVAARAIVEDVRVVESFQWEHKMHGGLERTTAAVVLEVRSAAVPDTVLVPLAVHIAVEVVLAVHIAVDRVHAARMAVEMARQSKVGLGHRMSAVHLVRTADAVDQVDLVDQAVLDSIPGIDHTMCGVAAEELAPVMAEQHVALATVKPAVAARVGIVQDSTAAVESIAVADRIGNLDQRAVQADLADLVAAHLEYDLVVVLGLAPHIDTHLAANKAADIDPAVHLRMDQAHHQVCTDIAHIAVVVPAARNYIQRPRHQRQRQCRIDIRIRSHIRCNRYLRHISEWKPPSSHRRTALRLGISC